MKILITRENNNLNDIVKGNSIRFNKTQGQEKINKYLVSFLNTRQVVVDTERVGINENVNRKFSFLKISNKV